MKRRASVDVRTGLRAEIELALRLLGKTPLDDESVHAFRQALKRARAALRLLRHSVSEAAYAKENARLRDAARPLAPVRDATVTLELVEEMLAAGKLPRYRPVLLQLRKRLTHSHARRASQAGARRSSETMRRLLEQTLEHIVHWRLPRDAPGVYASGLRRIYRKGRRELRTALARGDAQSLHECRKQVKYLSAAAALAMPAAWPDAKERKLADEIARELGDEHDLVLLASALRRTAPERALAFKLERKRSRLRKRAIKLARRLYKRPPARFVDPIAGKVTAGIP